MTHSAPPWKEGVAPIDNWALIIRQNIFDKHITSYQFLTLSKSEKALLSLYNQNRFEPMPPPPWNRARDNGKKLYKLGFSIGSGKIWVFSQINKN